MIPEELQLIIDDAKEKMKEAVSFCKSEFTYIRAGKATPTLLDGIKIDYYGSLTPLNQLATVTAPEPRMLVVQPYDRSSIESIEKAIMASNLGLNPNNDGMLIRIPLPMLSEERRKELEKHAKEVAEKASVSIRNSRREANHEIKATVQNESIPEDSNYAAEEVVKKRTDDHIRQIE